MEREGMIYCWIGQFFICYIMNEYDKLRRYLLATEWGKKTVQITKLNTVFFLKPSSILSIFLLTLIKLFVLLIYQLSLMLKYCHMKSFILLIFYSLFFNILSSSLSHTSTQPLLFSKQTQQTYKQNNLKTIDSLFIRLPSPNEINDLCMTGDSVAILRSIQSAITDDSIDCKQRVSFMLDMEGKIRKVANIKKKEKKELEGKIQKMEAEIEKFDRMIERLERKKQQVGLGNMKNIFQTTFQKLEQGYQQYNQNEQQSQKNKLQIAQLQKQIVAEETESHKQKNRILQDSIKLASLTELIHRYSLSGQLIQQKKNNLQNSISQSSSLVNQSHQNISAKKVEIAGLQNEIRKRKERNFELKKLMAEYQISLERMKVTLPILQTKSKSISEEIQIYQFIIKQQTEDHYYLLLSRLLQTIQRLNSLLPIVVKEIDKYYYYCYAEKVGKMKPRGDGYEIIIESGNISQYLMTVYGQPSIVVQKEAINLGRVNLSSLIKQRINQYLHTFDCLSTSGVEKGFGYLKRITFNSLFLITHDKKVIEFKLGFCTRIETISPLYPGLIVYYEALPTHKANYLYKASCF